MCPQHRSPTPTLFSPRSMQRAYSSNGDEVSPPLPRLGGDDRKSHILSELSALTRQLSVTSEALFQCHVEFTSPVEGKAHQHQHQHQQRPKWKWQRLSFCTTTRTALQTGAATAAVLAPPACLPFLPSVRVGKKKNNKTAASELAAAASKPKKAVYQHVKLGLDRIRPYLETHGSHGMAYGHLHKAQFHFEVRGLGLVSYCWVRSVLGRTAFVTCDPLAAPGADTVELLREFHATVPGMKQYCGVGQATADALKALGYTATVFGNDYQATYADWTVPKGRRRYLNEGTRAGLVVEELKYADLTEAEHARVQEISAQWLGGKAGFGAELQMMTYPFYEEDEWAVRKFYCFDKPRAEGGKMLAYIFFTPCFRDGQVVGHNANILRRDPTLDKKLSYVLDFVLCHCEKRFRAEGASFLSLSFSPLHGLAPAAGDSPFLRRTFQRWYNLPSRLYSKQGLGKHKDFFRMNKMGKVYVCAKGARAHVAVLDLVLTVTNILPMAKRRHGIES